MNWVTWVVEKLYIQLPSLYGIVCIPMTEQVKCFTSVHVYNTQYQYLMPPPSLRVVCVCIYTCIVVYIASYSLFNLVPIRDNLSVPMNPGHTHWIQDTCSEFRTQLVNSGYVDTSVIGMPTKLSIQDNHATLFCVPSCCVIVAYWYSLAVFFLQSPRLSWLKPAVQQPPYLDSPQSPHPIYCCRVYTLKVCTVLTVQWCHKD